MSKRWLWFLCLWVFVPSALAQLPNPALSALRPMGGQRGASVRVQAFGDNLDEARELILSGNGQPPRPLGIGTNQPNLPVAGEAFFHVTLPADLPSGVYEARFLGRFGLSNPRAFVVDEMAESAPGRGGDKPEDAAEVTLPALINGWTEPSRINYHRFKLDAGQRILIDIAARDLDSRLEPRMVLLGPDRAEIAHGQRGEGIDFKASQAGAYCLAVSDTTYRGGPDYGYRLEISTRPRVDSIWRTGLNSFEIVGRSIPSSAQWSGPKWKGSPLEYLRRDSFSPQTASTGFRRVVEEDASAKRADPGFAPALADFPALPDWPDQTWSGKVLMGGGPPTAIQPPCVIPMLLPPARSNNMCEFTAHKGEVWMLEVFSHRLGLLTSPLLLLQRVTTNRSGKVEFSDIRDARGRDGDIGTPEYPFASRDPVMRWEVGEDGLYRVSVRDLFATTTSDPRRVAYLSIRHPAPRFTAVATPVMPLNVNRDTKDSLRWPANLPPGGYIPIRIFVQRHDGFDDPVEIKLQNPGPLHAMPCLIARGKSVGYLWLACETNTAPATFLMDLVASSGAHSVKIAGATVVTPAGDYNTEPTSSRLTRDSLALAIPSTGPVALAAVLATNTVWETSRAGKLSIPYTLVKNGELTGSMKIRTMLDPTKEFEVDTKATNFNLDLEISQAKLAPGKHTVGLLLQPRVKFNRYSAEAKAKIETLKKETQATIDANSKEGGDKGKKEQAVKELDNLKNLLNTSEITASFYAEPVEITVHEMPLTIALQPDAMKVAPGQKAEIKCLLTRRFGFEDAVDLSLSGPDALKEATYGKVTIAKGATEGVLVLETKPSTPAGSHSLKLTTTLKFNGEDLKAEQAVPLQIAP